NTTRSAGKPHANAKRKIQPFQSRTTTTLREIQAAAVTGKPTTTYAQRLQDEEQQQSNSITQMIRDKDQINYARKIDIYSTVNISLQEQYFELMNRTTTQADGYIASITTTRGQSPMILLCDPVQIQEVIKNCCNPDCEENSILGIDTTFDLGTFYVTPTTFRNRCVRQVRTGYYPLMSGPVLISYNKNFEAYSHLLLYIQDVTNTAGKKLIAIGSDGDGAIMKAINTHLSTTTHLLCTRHVLKNIERKLKEMNSSECDRDKIISSIFYDKDSLISAESDEHYDLLFENLHDLWNDHAPDGFVEWFRDYYEYKFKHNLIASARQQAGIKPNDKYTPFYYTNDNESFNHKLKNETDWTTKPLLQIVEMLQRSAQTEETLLIRSMQQIGEFSLVGQFQKFQYDTIIWNGKSDDERTNIKQKFHETQFVTSHPQRR
ncbi:unnamed protein product, partial [Didymodactylos carnosus]